MMMAGRRCDKLRGLLCVIFSVGFILRLPAQLPDEHAARTFAADFLREKKVVSKRGGGNLELLHAAKGGYLFTPSDGQGFVWIGGTTEMPVVMGYSMTGCVREATLPPALSDMMNAVPDVHALRNTQETTIPIQPLLSSVWVQEEPYNGKCPYYRYDDGKLSANRCLVGCVATAVSEVVRYYAHPVALLDTLHGWKTAHYELDDVLPGTRIDWQNILDRYDEGYTDAEAEAIQDLSLYCGMACQMNYSPNASGSNIYKLVEPLERVFGYRYVNFYDHALYSPEAWNSLLRFELRRGVPLVYSGFNFQFTGHAFVIDGMDDRGLYHTRWGEADGFYDGYFDIDRLGAFESQEQFTEIGRQIGMFCNQCALAFHPEPMEAYSGDTLTYQAEDVTVDVVRFHRNPDTNGMVVADVAVTNHSTDTIRYTMLAFVSDSEEVEGWTGVDNVGFVGMTLYPGTTTEVCLFCDFKRSGCRYFGLTGDQEHLLYMEPLQVDEGGAYKLTVGDGEVLQLGERDVTLRLCAKNESEAGWCGDFLTYCLYPWDGIYYRAHWCQLELAPGEMMSDTVSFGCLEPDTKYVLRVRCPWTVIYEYEFTTLPSDGIRDIPAEREDDCMIYTLQGVCVASVKPEEYADVMRRLPRGVYIVSSCGGAPKKVFNH